MGLTSRLFLAFGVVIALAAAAAVYGMSVVSRTTGDVVQLYDGPLMAVSHARSAQLNFTAVSAQRDGYGAGAPGRAAPARLNAGEQGTPPSRCGTRTQNGSAGGVGQAGRRGG